MGTDSADLFGRENVDAHESMCGCEPLRHFSGKRLEIGQSVRRGPVYAGRIDPRVAVGDHVAEPDGTTEGFACRGGDDAMLVETSEALGE